MGTRTIGPIAFTATRAADTTGYTNTVRFPEAGNFLGADLAVANVSVRLSSEAGEHEATAATVKVSFSDDTIDANTPDTALMYESANTTGITESATASFLDDSPAEPLYAQVQQVGGPGLAIEVTATPGGGGGTSVFHGAITFYARAT